MESKMSKRNPVISILSELQFVPRVSLSAEESTDSAKEPDNFGWFLRLCNFNISDILDIFLWSSLRLSIHGNPTVAREASWRVSEDGGVSTIQEDGGGDAESAHYNACYWWCCLNQVVVCLGSLNLRGWRGVDVGDVEQAVIFWWNWQRGLRMLHTDVDRSFVYWSPSKWINDELKW